MKLSNFILTAIGALMCLSVIAYSFHAKNNLTQILRPPTKPWVIPQGDFTEIIDTQAYNNLVVDFNMVELDPQRSDYLKIEGYGPAMDYVQYRYDADTLYIEGTEIADTNHLVNIENEPNLKVIVGAKTLQSITINRKGKIYHSLSPYGSDEQGQQVYHEELWDKYALDNERLRIVMNGGTGSFLLNAGILDLDFNVASGRLNSITLVGSLGELNIIEPRGQLGIFANSLRLGRLNYHESEKNLTAGTISVSKTEQINATLFHNLDLYYEDNPAIDKRETGYGRLMKSSSRSTPVITTTTQSFLRF